MFEFLTPFIGGVQLDSIPESLKMIPINPLTAFDGLFDGVDTIFNHGDKSVHALINVPKILNIQEAATESSADEETDAEVVEQVPQRKFINGGYLPTRHSVLQKIMLDLTKLEQIPALTDMFVVPEIPALGDIFSVPDQYLSHIRNKLADIPSPIASIGLGHKLIGRELGAIDGFLGRNGFLADFELPKLTDFELPKLTDFELPKIAQFELPILTDLDLPLLQFDNVISSLKVAEAQKGAIMKRVASTLKLHDIREKLSKIMH